MGPEFNFPKSITEYWKKEDIYNFLRNPQSYRYSAKMPAVKLSREDFEEIYGYLKAMKGVKSEKWKVKKLIQWWNPNGVPAFHFSLLVFHLKIGVRFFQIQCLDPDIPVKHVVAFGL